MEFIRGIHNLKKEHHGCVITIGNFDGVHLGHQQLLQKLKEKGKQLHVPTLVITFEPQPNEYFYQGKIPPRLMRLREKFIALQQLGIDRLLCIRFDAAFAEMTAAEFVKEILLRKLGMQFIIVGDDFRFGHNRQGDFAFLQNYASRNNFSVEHLPTFEVAGNRISSTLIRKLLEHGDLLSAKKYLGHPFILSGRVAHGDKRGRIIGFPTANIYLHRKAVPILGVYAVKVFGLGVQPIYGVANVGNRPTVDGTRSLLEVHLFDFNKNIYGKHIEVEFVKKLRDEQRFDSFELLKQQIFNDAEAAKQYFKISA